MSVFAFYYLLVGTFIRRRVLRKNAYIEQIVRLFRFWLTEDDFKMCVVSGRRSTLRIYNWMGDLSVFVGEVILMGLFEEGEITGDLG